MNPGTTGAWGLIPWSPWRGASRRQPDKENWARPRARSDDFAHDMYYEGFRLQVVARVTELPKRGVPNAQVASLAVTATRGERAPSSAPGSAPRGCSRGAVRETGCREPEALAEAYKPHPVLGNLR
jgi:aryl-alcohol dehydrogenase (NADP+)